MSQENSERDFLHDISSPVSSIHFLMAGILEDLKSKPTGIEPDLLERMQLVVDSITKLETLIEGRRAVLLKGSK